MGGGEELTRKIFRSILTVGVAVLACSLLLVMGCFYSFYEGMQEHQLGDELRIAAAAVETNGSTYLEKIKSDRFRVTWIASDGTVLYDTQADAASMENHASREEVQQAFYKVSEKLYQQANPQGGAQPGGNTQKPGDDGVVDADYESVD